MNNRNTILIALLIVGLVSTGFVGVSIATEEDGEFSITEHPTHVDASPGEPITVNVSVNNTGETTATQTVELFIDEGDEEDEIDDAVEVELEPDEEKIVSLETTAPDEEAEYAADVSTADDSVGLTVDTTGDDEEADEEGFEVADIEPEQIESDLSETTPVSTTVTNTGEDEFTDVVGLTVIEEGGETTEVTDEKEVTIGAGESETVSLDATAPETPGEHEFAVWSGTTEINGGLVVEGLDELTVDGEGDSEDSFETIEEGLDAATEGAEISVESGTYEPEFELQISVSGVELIAVDGPEQTTIQAPVRIDSENVALTGFTVEPEEMEEIGIQTGPGAYNATVTDNIVEGEVEEDISVNAGMDVQVENNVLNGTSDFTFDDGAISVWADDLAEMNGEAVETDRDLLEVLTESNDFEYLQTPFDTYTEEALETTISGTVLAEDGEQPADGFVALYFDDQPSVPVDGLREDGGVYAPSVGDELSESGEYEMTLPSEANFREAILVYGQGDLSEDNLGDGLLPADNIPDTQKLGVLSNDPMINIPAGEKIDRENQTLVPLDEGDDRDAAEPRDGNFDFEQQELTEGHNVTVNVTDNHGEPLEDAAVLVSDELSGPGTWLGLTNEDGSFVSDRVPANITSGNEYWQGQTLFEAFDGIEDGDLVHVEDDGETVIDDPPMTDAGLNTGELATGTYYIADDGEPVEFDDNELVDVGVDTEDATWEVVDSSIERTEPGIELANSTWNIMAEVPLDERFSYFYEQNVTTEIDSDDHFEFEFAPVASFDAPEEAGVGAPTEFEVTVDEDRTGPEEEIKTIELRFGDGAVETVFDSDEDEYDGATTALSEHIYDMEGEVTAEVVVTTERPVEQWEMDGEETTDDEETTDEETIETFEYVDTQTISVVTAEPVPALETPETATEGEQIHLDASESEDEFGIVHFEWTVTDEDGETVEQQITEGDEPTLETEIEESGEYDVSVTVLNTGGNENTTSQSIEIVEAANLATDLDVADGQPLREEPTANVTVENVGTETAESDDGFEVIVNASGTPFGADDEEVLSKSFTVDENLTGGESVTEELEFDFIEDRIVGDVDFAAEADPDDVVDEATTETNVDTETAEITYTNLVVDNYAPDVVSEAEEIGLRSYVRNDGTAPSEQSEINITVSNETDQVVNETTGVGELDAGDRQRNETETQLEPGEYTFELEVEDELFDENTSVETEFEVEEFELDIDEESIRVPESISGESNFTAVFGFESSASLPVNATLDLSDADGVEFADGWEDTQTTTVEDVTSNRANVVAYDLRTTNESGETDIDFEVEDTADVGEQADITESTNVTVPTERITNTTAVSFDGENEEETAAIELFGDDVTNDQEIEISVQGGSDGRTLQGLEYLVTYPYGCVEQTTSAFLGALNTDEYYEDRTSDISEERQDTINGSIEEGVERLKQDGLRGQQDAGEDEGSWNQWGREGQAGQSYFTAYALFGAASVDNNEIHSERNDDELGDIDFDAAVEWLADENWDQPDGYLNDEPASTGFSMVSLAEANRSDETNEDTIDLIAEVYANASVELLDSSQDVADGVAWEDEEARSTALAVHGLQLALDASAYEEHEDLNEDDLEETIDDGVDWLEANQHADGSWDAYNDLWFNSEGDKSETTATALMALNETGMDDENATVEDGTDYLMDIYESDGSWGYPRATQAAIDALNELTPGAAERSMNVTLHSNNGESVTKDELDVDTDTQTVDVELSEGEIDDLTPESDSEEIMITVEDDDSGEELVTVAIETEQDVERPALEGEQ